MRSIGMKRTHSNVSHQDLSNIMNGKDDEGKVPTNMDAFLAHLVSGDAPNSIIIDCTTSDAIAQLHPKWLVGGAHVVCSSKRGIASSYDLYQSIFKAAASSKRMYMSETTIGASLPINTTLHDILCSGDAVHAIVGLMSVSVGVVITDICENNSSFTQALSHTYKTGLFEDDVFVDLEGREAAQKLLILARQLGYPLNLEDIEVEALAKRRIVSDWNNLGTLFAEEDSALSARAAAAKAKGCTLRYVQRIECTPPAELGCDTTIKPKATVRLEEVPLNSPFAMVKGAVYYFAFHTERYKQHPLIVQGPLSDSANAASGVVGDILRIAKSMGARDRGQKL